MSKIKNSILFFNKILAPFHKLVNRLFDSMGEGHQGGADDEHSDAPHELCEACSEDGDGTKLSNEGHKKAK